jgi:hypothetical protein
MTTLDLKIAAKEAELKRRSDRDGVMGVLLCVVSIPLLLAFFWLLPSYYEAKTYRRLTGAEVTMWDAMWCELRVQEPTSRD